jgi:hypothetical protein
MKEATAVNELCRPIYVYSFMLGIFMIDIAISHSCKK